MFVFHSTPGQMGIRFCNFNWSFDLAWQCFTSSRWYYPPTDFGHFTLTGDGLLFPAWFAVLAGISAFAVPLLSLRYSLRTLLIVTALVAVAQGWRFRGEQIVGTYFSASATANCSRALGRRTSKAAYDGGLFHPR